MQGYTYFFLFLFQNIACGYSLEPSRKNKKNKKKYNEILDFFYNQKTFLDIAWTCFRNVELKQTLTIALLLLPVKISNMIRPKKINVLFPETSKYFYGSVGRQNFFLEIIFCIGKA